MIAGIPEAALLPLPEWDLTQRNHFRFGYDGASFALRRHPAQRYWTSYAGCGRRHFEHHLVGFDFDQDFVGSNRFTGFLFPLQHGGFRHRLGQLRDFDFYDSHVDFSLKVKRQFVLGITCSTQSP